MRSLKIILKALLATGIATLPVAIKQFATDDWSVNLFVAYLLAVFATSLKLFEPDNRFLAVREPTVKIFLKANLSGAPKGVRANIFVCRRFWFRKSLIPLISYNPNTSLADYGKAWPSGRGLCWQVYRKGQFSCYRKGVDRLADFNMRKSDKEATSHVELVFCIPLRSKPKSGNDDGVSGKVTAVLAFDAISAAGAEFLAEEYERLRNHQNPELLDLVEAVSLFF